MAATARPLKPLVIIPAFNEAGSIQHVVGAVRAAVPEADVLVIDDGSRDRTADLALAAGAFVVRHPFNLCIGGAVQTGLKFALEREYDCVMRVDGDGQHNPLELPALYALMQTEHADAVFGSRFMGQDPTMRIPLSRRLGINTFARLVSLITRQPATDTTSGFFCLNRTAAKALAAYVPQDYPEVEGRVILHKAGLKVTEMPAHMQARQAGISSITAWRSFYYAFKVSVAVLISALKEFKPPSGVRPIARVVSRTVRADLQEVDR